MGDIERIAKLLLAEDQELVVAAAIVLGELGAKAPAAVDGLLLLAESGAPVVQLRALEALARIAPKRAERRLLPLLAEGPTEVRRAAGRALTALGPGVVKQLRARVEEAGVEEHRIISEVLSGVGGQDAFSTLLESLAHLDGVQGRKTALAARQQLRGLPVAERKQRLTQVKQFLRRKATRESPDSTQAAIKLLGFLELPEAMPLLMETMTDRGLSEPVRLEAVLGLRFALGAARRPADKAVAVAPLLAVIEEAPEELARAAQDTLAFVPLTGTAVPGLLGLAGHPSLERARFAVVALASLESDEATAALATLVASGGRITSEAAAEALRERPTAAAALAKALLAAEALEPAWALARALEPHVGQLEARLRNRLVAAALAGLDAEAPTWEALLRVARLAAADQIAAGLRERVVAARRKKDKLPARRLLRLLDQSPEATDQDRFALAALELRESGLDLKRPSRDRDPALGRLAALAGRGFDVAGALTRERGLALEALYYVGFHLAEEDEPAGEALLEHVAKTGGRKKIAQAAKNKLKLVAG